MDSPSIRWRGMNAAYTASERELMRDLPVREQALVHTLKAFTHGDATEPTPLRQETGEMIGFAPAPSTEAGGLFIDPEDIPFGTDRPKKTRPIYALVCTWKQSCRVPTKGEGEFWTKVWKLWYERKGWKIQSHDTGYFASKDGERHAILLHEYDKDTKERLK